jgi:hypothetical protein
MAVEREAFGRYVAGLQATDLDAVAALPYRRVFTADEARSIWSALGICGKSRQGIGIR